MKQVLLVDGLALTRWALAHLVEAEGDLEVCLQAATAEQALEWMKEGSADAAVIELSLQDMNGLDLIRTLHRERPQMALVGMSVQNDVLCAERTLRAGAMGYVTKQEAEESLVPALRRALGGEYFLQEGLLNQLLRAVVQAPSGLILSPKEALSGRELEVFELTGHGFSAQEIADRLALSAKTVDSYRARIRSKLHIEGMADLVREAVRWLEVQSKCACHCGPNGCHSG